MSKLSAVGPAPSLFPRFSLRTLLACCGFCAITSAGFQYGPTYVTLLTLALLLIAIISASIVAIRGPRERAVYWGSFALTTAVFGFLALWHRDMLPTTALFRWVWLQFPVDRTNCFPQSLAATQITGNCVVAAIAGLVVGQFAVRATHIQSHLDLTER